MRPVKNSFDKQNIHPTSEAPHFFLSCGHDVNTFDPLKKINAAPEDHIVETETQTGREARRKSKVCFSALEPTPQKVKMTSS